MVKMATKESKTRVSQESIEGVNIFRNTSLCFCFNGWNYKNFIEQVFIKGVNMVRNLSRSINLGTKPFFPEERVWGSV